MYHPLRLRHYLSWLLTLHPYVGVSDRNYLLLLEAPQLKRKEP